MTVATAAMKMQQLTKEDEVAVGNKGIAHVGTGPMKTTTQTLVGSGWWKRDHHDDDGDDRQGDRGRDLARGFFNGNTRSRRDRTRSPRPRNKEYNDRSGGRRTHGAGPTEAQHGGGELSGAAGPNSQHAPDPAQQKEIVAMDTGAGDIGHMDHTAVDDDEEATSNAELPPLDTVVVDMTTVIDQATRDVDTLPPKTNDSTPPKLIMQVNELFVSPPKPIISMPPATAGAVVGRRAKPRLLPSSTNTRHSARLVRQPALTAMERCQRVLLRRMGLMQKEDDVTAIQEVLAQYIAMFDGPLPPDVIATLTTVFGIDNEDNNNPTNAIVRVMGEGIADAVEEVEEALA
uniref:Uncharacterized protein n=1 Tax=Oryza brachyantha TaxID=4533 RepID=J3L5D9_ORYBR